MKFATTSGSLGDQEADALLIFVNADNQLDDAGREVDAALDGQLRNALTSVGFSGKSGSACVLPTFGRIPAQRVIAVGMGDPADRTIDSIRSAWGTAARKAREAGATTIAGAMPPDTSGPVGQRSAVEGIRLGLYEHREYRSNQEQGNQIESATLVYGGAGDHDNGVLLAGDQLASGICLARDLVNTPGLDLFPERLAGRAWEVADQFGLEYIDYDRAALTEMGAGAIVGVGQGSAREPRLIHLTYRPEGESRGTFGFVGKAITFDTGGVNLKPADGMRDMKIDMAGGAAVIGAMRAIAELKPPFTVHGVVAAAENMPSHTAYRPGDVLRTMSGKTVEITNTDAEGRLVLADALTYTVRQGAEMMVDLATLTGASIVALGNEAASLFGTDDRLVNNLRDAAQFGGERVWRMPLWDSYRSNLDSIIADIMNSGSRDGGAIKAALFLKEFTEGKPWAHLDIAGPAWSTKQEGYRQKGATGFGVHTLVTLLERWQ